MRIAVAGGTGVVGRHVVAALEAAGHDVAVLSRSRGVDVVTGEGLDGPLTGASALVDVTDAGTLRRGRAVAFFTTATRRLLDAEQRAGVGHHVVLSIVGVDRVGTGYYEGKRRQEELALAGPVPATVVRATQFHEFPAQLLARARGPVVLVPRMRVQPVAAREVGALLAEIATGPVPAGPDRQEIGGPEQHDVGDLVRRVARDRGDRRPVLDLRLPGAAARAATSGALLPGPGARLGAQTFAEHLAERS